MAITVRAIDVGFGQTKYVTGSNEGRVECAHFPSLAFYSPLPPKGDSLGGRRRTVCVPVGGLFYEVGPDVELAADRFRCRQLHDGYAATDEYRALTAGALFYMKQDVIDLLVVGLPVATYLSQKTALEKTTTGLFEVGRKRSVEVRRALVVAQPQGALAAHAAGAGLPAKALVAKTLVIDVGARTFDWLLVRGGRVVARMSHSVNRGLFDVLRGIAEAIGTEVGTDYGDLEAIDAALRSGSSLRVYQKDHDLKRFATLIAKVADEAVAAMLSRLDSTHDVEAIVLVGGGAPLFGKAIRRRFPRHVVESVPDPLYANVRGFQLLGEDFARVNPQLFEEQATRAATGLPAGNRGDGKFGELREAGAQGSSPLDAGEVPR